MKSDYGQAGLHQGMAPVLFTVHRRLRQEQRAVTDEEFLVSPHRITCMQPWPSWHAVEKVARRRAFRHTQQLL